MIGTVDASVGSHTAPTMKNTHTITAAFLAAASTIAASAADAPASAYTVTGNVALTSDYVFRGISQSAGHTSIQGGFDLTKTPLAGLTAGVWASSLSAGTEVDFYANYGFKVGVVDVSVGFIDYTYTASAVGFSTGGEANLAVSYSGVTLKASKGVSGALSDYYYEASYSYDIPAVKGLNLGLHYGTDRVTKNDDLSVTLTYPVFGFDAIVAYSDIEGGSSITSFTVKKSF